MADRADDRPQRRGPHLLADSARFGGGGECSSQDEANRAADATAFAVREPAPPSS
jgi:hypothetical protein